MYKLLLTCLVALLTLPATHAQKIFLDQQITAGDGVVLFPSVDNPDEWYYLPDRPRVSIANGNPQFSFTLFTEKDRSGLMAENKEDQKGGGIVHFMVTFGLDATRLANARAELANLRPGAVIKGPVIYKSGNIALISAVADTMGGHTKKVLGLGKAPVIEGSKAAIAFMLDARGAKLLWSTFETPTPDVSFSMEMEVDGYLTPIKGWVKGNFEQIYESHEASLGVSGTIPGVLTLGAEIGATFEKLEKNGSIETYIEDDDASMQALLDAAYDKLLKMMFVPLDSSYAVAKGKGSGEPKANGKQESPLDRLAAFLDRDKDDDEESAPAASPAATPTAPTPAAQEAESGSSGTGARGNGSGGHNHRGPSMPDWVPPIFRSQPKMVATVPAAPFSLMASYTFRQTRQSGNFKIDLNKVSASSRSLRFDGNVGNIKEQCAECFHVVYLDEMTMFKQREITVLLDGSLLDNFKDYVNSVSVSLRKRHPSGYVELEEANIDYALFTANGRVAKLVYGREENETEGWETYEYRIDWNFHGNHVVRGEWRESDGNVIALNAPLERKLVIVDADPGSVAANNIRKIIVMLEYEMGGSPRRERVVLAADGLLTSQVPVILPHSSEAVRYRYSVITTDGETHPAGPAQPVQMLYLSTITKLPTSED